jgi:hypothetical protein
MRNWKQSTLVGILAFFLLAFVACDNGGNNDPKPEEQNTPIPIAEGKTVTVTYWALPNTTPVWWDTLVSALENRAGGFASGNFTLNVTTNGTNGFIAGEIGSGTATVSETYLSQTDYETMRTAINGILDDWGWIAP